jgi:hypothetical protein
MIPPMTPLKWLDNTFKKQKLSHCPMLIWTLRSRTEKNLILSVVGTGQTFHTSQKNSMSSAQRDERERWKGETYSTGQYIGAEAKADLSLLAIAHNRIQLRCRWRNKAAIEEKSLQIPAKKILIMERQGDRYLDRKSRHRYVFFLQQYQGLLLKKCCRNSFFFFQMQTEYCKSNRKKLFTQKQMGWNVIE